MMPVSDQLAERLRLLDLRFLEHDVFARHRIIFPKFHFFSKCPRILLGYVIKSRVCCADQLYKNGTCFRHDQISGLKWCNVFWRAKYSALRCCQASSFSWQVTAPYWGSFVLFSLGTLIASSTGFLASNVASSSARA
jgi:hypothetical protein